MSRSIHLGCGFKKRPGAIGVDINAGSKADVRCDLNFIPYPFSNNCFDEIICEHILEHLEDLIAVVEEIYRIAQPNARLVVEVPYFSSIFFYQDPTHRHAFTTRSFDYFIEGTDVNKFGYAQTRLKRIKVEFPPPKNAGILKRVVYSLINRNIDLYEKYLAFIIPRHLLSFELRIIK